MKTPKRDDTLEEAKRLAVLLEIGARMIDGLNDHMPGQARCKESAAGAMADVQEYVADYIAERKQMT